MGDLLPPLKKGSHTPNHTPATLREALCTKGSGGVQKMVIIHLIIHLIMFSTTKQG